jgi:hypothetical protein
VDTVADQGQPRITVPVTRGMFVAQARGTQGWEYPWGNGSPGSQLCWTKSDGTCRVGSYPSGDSPFGLKDMTGNVWEWTSSGYSDDYSRNRARTLGNDAVNANATNRGPVHHARFPDNAGSGVHECHGPVRDDVRGTSSAATPSSSGVGRSCGSGACTPSIAMVCPRLTHPKAKVDPDEVTPKPSVSALAPSTACLRVFPKGARMGLRDVKR